VQLEGLIKELHHNALTGKVMDIPVKTLQPKVTATLIQSQLPTTLLSSYSTRFVNNYSRTENLRVASKNLYGTLIEPGGTFSFNGTLGERTAEQGYKDALIIVNGKFVPGLAGGLCQVSSTLYNALLFADLNVTERWNHSLKVAYVPMGQDATVNYGMQDLKFVNNTDGYILIKNQMKGQYLSFFIYGNAEHMVGKKIKVWATLESVIPNKTETIEDNTMLQGEKVIETAGMPGYKSSTYLQKTDHGVTTTKKISKSYYKPLNTVIRIGTGLNPQSSPLNNEVGGDSITL
jgi:vancomycin resistance protein YoaR